MRQNEISEYLLARAPKRNHEWRESENRAVILIPKFGDHFLGRWLKAKMKSPNYKLNLDEIGSFVWKHCDGTKTVEDIGQELEAEFGEKVAPVYDRLNLFFMSLSRSKSITWM